jgi:hypothetical protein
MRRGIPAGSGLVCQINTSGAVLWGCRQPEITLWGGFEWNELRTCQLCLYLWYLSRTHLRLRQYETSRWAQVGVMVWSDPLEPWWMLWGRYRNLTVALELIPCFDRDICTRSAYHPPHIWQSVRINVVASNFRTFVFLRSIHQVELHLEIRTLKY